MYAKGPRRTGGGLEAVNLRSMVGRKGEMGRERGERGEGTCASHVTPALCEDSQP